MSRHNTLFFTVLSALVLLLFLLDLMAGAVDISLHDIWTTLTGGEVESSKILLRFRLPKSLVAVLTGVSLSVAGLQMQTVFRNPLADPYVLGVSSGAGLGVALFILGASSFPLIESFRNVGIYVAAFAGSALVLTLILAVSTRVKDVMSILIIGVMFGNGVSAIISVLQYFGTGTEVKTYIMWTLGSLGSVASDKLLLMTLALTVGIIISVCSIKPLNALLLGENYARSLGVNIGRARNTVFLGTSILTATATAFCGPIGFIGIAVPHLARMLFRQADHRVLMPGVMLLGACIMLLCDLISQSAAGNLALPINSITALLGIPVIIFVIVAYNKRKMG